MERTQALMMAYYDLNSIRSCLDTLIRENSFTITVAENYSENTESQIKPYLMDMVNSGVIKRYFLFEKNITNNIILSVLKDRTSVINYTPHTLITDGSLSTKDTGWSIKQKELLDRSASILTCAVNIDTSNMPSGQENYFNPVMRSDKETDVIFTGNHMLLFRSNELIDIIKYLDTKSLPYKDSYLHMYCAEHGKSWVRLKSPKFYRHTWDFFSVPNHPYLVEKQRRISNKDIFDHKDMCNYTLHVKDESFHSTEITEDLAKKIKRKIACEYITEYYYGHESVCGEGSTIDSAKDIIAQLPNIFSEFKISSLLDIGCGDFNWMRFIDISNIEYEGWDYNKILIDNNNATYPSLKFLYKDAVESTPDKFDAILCRDVIFHLSFENAIKLINNFKISGSKYLISTSFPDVKVNVDLTDVEKNRELGFRKINLSLPPYNMGEPLYSFVETAPVCGGRIIGVWRISDANK